MFDILAVLLRRSPKPQHDPQLLDETKRVADALQRDHSIVVIYPGSSFTFIARGLTKAEAEARLPRERERYQSLLRPYRIPVTQVPVVMRTTEAERIEAEIEAAKPKPKPAPVRVPPTDEEWAELVRKAQERDAEELSYVTDPTQRWLILLSRGLIEADHPIEVGDEVESEEAA